ncbi:hypothetical protein [Burkholderia cenocepacia]|uniref:hypothetical protein n=1 Tax=Burkholderia cenocepacia TaxID=95486 RepID=UPI002AAF9B14|nr:hypothetical protein [Burkholderia cenocepacia]
MEHLNFVQFNLDEATIRLIEEDAALLRKAQRADPPYYRDEHAQKRAELVQRLGTLALNAIKRR